MAVQTDRILCYNPRTKQFKPVLVNETLDCVNIELGTDTEKGVQLTEQPSPDTLNYSVIVKRVSDDLVFTETTSDTISSTEFLVDYTTGSGNIILNSSTTLGESFLITYYSVGSINTISNIFSSGSLGILGSLDASSRKIVSLADATIASANKDAVTGGQLYTEQETRISSDDTLQGNIDTINSNLGGYLPLAGGTMTGEIAMGSNKISGLPNATGLQSPATYSQLLNQFTNPQEDEYYLLRYDSFSISGASGTYAWNRGTILAAYLINSNDEIQMMQINDSYYFRYATNDAQFEWYVFGEGRRIRVIYFIAAI